MMMDYCDNDDDVHVSAHAGRAGVLSEDEEGQHHQGEGGATWLLEVVQATAAAAAPPSLIPAAVAPVPLDRPCDLYFFPKTWRTKRGAAALDGLDVCPEALSRVEHGSWERLMDCLRRNAPCPPLTEEDAKAWFSKGDVLGPEDNVEMSTASNAPADPADPTSRPRFWFPVVHSLHRLQLPTVVFVAVYEFTVSVILMSSDADDLPANCCHFSGWIWLPVGEPSSGRRAMAAALGLEFDEGAPGGWYAFRHKRVGELFAAAREGIRMDLKHLCPSKGSVAPAASTSWTRCLVAQPVLRASGGGSSSAGHGDRKQQRRNKRRRGVDCGGSSSANVAEAGEEARQAPHGPQLVNEIKLTAFGTMHVFNSEPLLRRLGGEPDRVARGMHFQWTTMDSMRMFDMFAILRCCFRFQSGQHLDKDLSVVREQLSIRQLLGAAGAASRHIQLSKRLISAASAAVMGVGDEDDEDADDADDANVGAAAALSSMPLVTACGGNDLLLHQLQGAAPSCLLSQVVACDDLPGVDDSPMAHEAPLREALIRAGSEEGEGTASVSSASGLAFEARMRAATFLSEEAEWFVHCESFTEERETHDRIVRDHSTTRYKPLFRRPGGAGGKGGKGDATRATDASSAANRNQPKQQQPRLGQKRDLRSAGLLQLKDADDEEDEDRRDCDRKARGGKKGRGRRAASSSSEPPKKKPKMIPIVFSKVRIPGPHTVIQNMIRAYFGRPPRRATVPTTSNE